MAGDEWADMDGDLIEVVLVEQFRCCDCNAWLPLGPSRDDDERVAIEIAAAGVAANWDAFHDLTYGAEFSGLVAMGAGPLGESYLDICIRERDAGRLGRKTDVRDLEIGLLAREIVTHEETP
jgi:hypothetical protein